MKGNNLVNIPNELDCVAVGTPVAAAESIYDYNLEKNQEDINQEHLDAMVSLGYVDPSSILPDPDDPWNSGYYADPNYDNETTINIDASISDPGSMITGSYYKPDTVAGDDDSARVIQNPRSVFARIKAKTHRYEVLSYSNNIATLKQMPDEGGGLSNTSNNVVVKIPTFWYKFTKTGKLSTITVTMIKPSDESNWTKWNENNLIGAFRCGLTTMESKINVIPSYGSYSKGQAFRDRLRTNYTNNYGYKYSVYRLYNILRLLYLGYYGNTNSRNTLGIGYASNHKTGNSLGLGMTDTTKTTSTTRTVVNFFGIEQPYGDYGEWIADLQRDQTNFSNQNYYWSTNATPKVQYEDMTEGYYWSDVAVGPNDSIAHVDDNNGNPSVFSGYCYDLKYLRGMMIPLSTNTGVSNSTYFTDYSMFEPRLAVSCVGIDTNYNNGGMFAQSITPSYVPYDLSNRYISANGYQYNFRTYLRVASYIINND